VDKYLTLLRGRLAAGLQYRTNIIGQLILDLQGLASVILLWTLIFSERSSVAGFSFGDSLLYFLLVPVVGALTGVYISEELGYEIRRGVLSANLLKPINIFAEAFTRALASKFNSLIITIPVYTAIFFFFIAGMHLVAVTAGQVLIAILMTVSGFLLHFTIDITVAWLAFWVGDVWAFKHLKRIVYLVFGGLIFPLDFVQGGARWIFEFLPFKFLYYVPAAYLLGRRSPGEFGGDMLGITLWSCLFLFIGWVLWKKGLVTYEAYGG